MTTNDPTRKTCGECRHWDAGECLRFPPQMVPTASDNQPPVIYWPVPFYPNVTATTRACGEFAKAASLPCL